MYLQPERINRSYSKSSTCNHRIPDYFSQVLIRDMDTRPVCSYVLTSGRSLFASRQTSDAVIWPDTMYFPASDVVPIQGYGHLDCGLPGRRFEPVPGSHFHHTPRLRPPPPEPGKGTHNPLVHPIAGESGGVRLGAAAFAGARQNWKFTTPTNTAT